MNEAAEIAEDTPVSAESETAVTESTDEPKEATTETTEGGDQQSGDDQPNDDEAQQKRSRFQERIKTLTDRRNEAEARAKEMEERLAAYEAKQEPTDPDPMPLPEQFDYDPNAYAQAMAEWSTKQAQAQIANQMTEQQRWQAEQAREQANREAMEAYNERANAFELDHPDFKQVAARYQIQSETVAQAVALTEEGPALQYHLAQNPHLAQQIESMPPALAGIELGRVIAKLTAPAPVTTSSTPEPAKPVTPSGKVEKSPDDMTPKEYQQWRNKQTGRS